MRKIDSLGNRSVVQLLLSLVTPARLGISFVSFNCILSKGTRRICRVRRRTIVRRLLDDVLGPTLGWLRARASRNAAIVDS